MELFELHVYNKGNWSRLDAFQERETAMSLAIRLQQEKQFSALKIIHETYDNTQNNFGKKLVYSWSDEHDRKVQALEDDKFLEERKQMRRTIRRNRKINSETKIQKMKSILFGVR